MLFCIMSLLGSRRHSGQLPQLLRFQCQHLAAGCILIFSLDSFVIKAPLDRFIFWQSMLLLKEKLGHMDLMEQWVELPFGTSIYKDPFCVLNYSACNPTSCICARKAASDSSGVCASAHPCVKLGWSCWPLTSAWPGFGCSHYLESKSTDGRWIFLSVCGILSLCTFQSLHLSNIYIFKEKKIWLVKFNRVHLK